jgi:hypothetical protein
MMTIDNSFFQRVLDFPFVSRIRRNHGLEHATMRILSQRHPKTGMAGHSDVGGFWLIGDVPLEEVQSAVQEALGRLKAGEADLAVHPNCGTNFATTGVMASLAAFAAMSGGGKRSRDRLERLPLAAVFATFAAILAQPLGLKLQEHVTTSGQPGALEVYEIIPTRRGQVNAYRVVTRG